MTDVDEVRTLLNARIDALARRDASAANATLDSHVVAFELAGPLQISPAQARDTAATQAWLESFDGGPTVTMQELTIFAEGSLALCHSLNRLRGKRIGGQEIDVTMRSTLGFQKLDGDWKIVHSHTSLPR